MNWKTQPRTPGIYIAAEVALQLSRENAVLAENQNLQAGTVLGRIAASGKYTQLDTAASNGAQTAAAILYRNTNATTADTQTVVTARLTAVTGDELIWPAGISAPNKTAAITALAAKQIIIV